MDWDGMVEYASPLDLEYENDNNKLEIKRKQKKQNGNSVIKKGPHARTHAHTRTLAVDDDGMHAWQ